MRFTRRWIKFFAVIIIAGLLLPVMQAGTDGCCSASANAPFRPQFTTLRVGLVFGSTAVPSANLQNADGFGRGFDFGTFNSNRDFVPIGAGTNEHRLTMLMDRNMVWHPAAAEGRGEFREEKFSRIFLDSL